MEDRHGQLAPRTRGGRRPRKRVERVGAEGERGGAGRGHDGRRAIRGTKRPRLLEHGHVEPPPRRCEQMLEREVAHAVHEPMVRKDRQPRRVRAEERHELVVAAGMTPRVLDGRLVTMVAVGDDHARARQQLLRAHDGDRIVDAPETMTLALQIARLRDRLAPRCAEREQLALRIAHQHEQHTGVGAGRLQQPHAVFLRARVRSLVRQHLAPHILRDLPDRDQPDPRDLVAVDDVRLMIRIDGGAFLRRPHSVRRPACQRLAGGAVLAVAGLARIRHANDVRGAQRIEELLLLWTDLIVGRRHHLADFALAANRVAVAAKRPHTHQDAARSTPTRPRRCSMSTMWECIAARAVSGSRARIAS